MKNLNIKSVILFVFLCIPFFLQANGIDNNDNGIPDIWENEYNITNYLPPIPNRPLYDNQIETDLEVRLDKIEAFPIPLNTYYDKTLCNISNFWDSSRVSVGGRTYGNGEDVCKVQLDNNHNLQFITKWPINNIHYPLTPEPAWARFRFPIPKGHIANEIEYALNWYKLFGSQPTNCLETELNTTTKACMLDVSNNWKSDVDAGLYLLWTTPNSTKQIMTGPHPPIETIGYSGIDTFKVKVPDEFKNVKELVVSFVAFNQYTKGCEKANSSKCTAHENENFRIKSVTLETEVPFTPSKEPALSHPRILGSNIEWNSYYKPFDDLECIHSDKDMDWGMVFNAKNIWDKTTKGFKPCHDEIVDSLSEVSDMNYYLNFQEGDKWNRKNALRIMFLLRKEMDCYTNNLDSCLYDKSDIEQLKEKFITSEMIRFDKIKWNYGYKCFDIGTEPPVKFWSIFVDTFWNDLKATSKQKIDTKLNEEIGCFLNQIKTKDWSIFNGNNWTPILDKAALYWAITYYHEDIRAKQVIKDILRTLWLHRDFYLSDGSYMEGIVEYTNISYSNLREINNLMQQSFHQSLESVRWKRIEKTTHWFLDFMVPDGKMADFGDSWDKRGWSTFDPLYMLMWEEMTGQKKIGETQLNACLVYEYFSNIWFAKGFEDPWSVQPSLARDWISIVKECNQSSIYETKQIFFNKAESGVLKNYIPNASPISKQDNMRFSQANYTWLGFNGVPNDFPHRELDFGALIWSAYGNRLLYDFGYGEIAKTSSHRPYLINDAKGTELWDNLALGANTLVVEDATTEHYTGGHYKDDLINTSQIYGARGTLKKLNINGYKAFVADGSAVYGKDDVEFGWLEFFNRYMIALDDGNFIVVDSFKTKDDRGDANIKEYWYTSDEEFNKTTCSYSYEKINLKLENSKSLLLNPLCSMLEREANSTVQARIVANSFHDGAFELNPNQIIYKTRTNTKIVRNRIKYGSLTPISEDIRIFLLQASAQDSIVDANISSNRCDNTTPCFDITIDGESKRLNFKKNSDEHFVINSFNHIKRVQLNAGWNLVGINQPLSLSDLKRELEEDNIEIIQGANKTYQKRYNNMDLEFLNDFRAFEIGKGYWIKLQHSADLTLKENNLSGNISLKSGWNIITPYKSLTLDQVIQQIGIDNLIVIQGENKSYKKDDVNIEQTSMNNFTKFEQNKGYWIKIIDNSELLF